MGSVMNARAVGVRAMELSLAVNLGEVPFLGGRLSRAGNEVNGRSKFCSSECRTVPEDVPCKVGHATNPIIYPHDNKLIKTIRAFCEIAELCCIYAPGRKLMFAAPSITC